MSSSKRKKATPAAAAAIDDMTHHETFEDVEAELVQDAMNKKPKGIEIEVVEEPDVPAPVAVQTVVAVAQAAPGAVVLKGLAMEDIDYESIDFMKLFYEGARSYRDSMRAGTLKLTVPDMALYMLSKKNNWNIHAFEFDPASVAPEPILNEEGVDTRIKSTLLQTILVDQAPEKFKNPATGKWETKPLGKVYVNVSNKRDQRFPPLGPLAKNKMYVLTPFCTTAFLKYGATPELGSEGTRGKVIKGEAVPDAAAQIQFQLSNKKFTFMQSNEDCNNPVAHHYIDVVRNNLNMFLLKKACANPSMLTEIRKAREAKEKAAAEKRKKEKREIDESEKRALERPLEQFIMEEGYFKNIETTEEGDATVKRTGFGVSCFRAVRIDKDTKEVNEDPEDLVPSSDLYSKVTVNKAGKPIIQFKLPVFRVRRADEIKAGETYTSPFIRVPHKEVCLTGRHVISVLYSHEFYEWQYDTAGVTQKPEAIIVLGEMGDLEAMDRDTVVPCNPTEAFPMAGPVRPPPAPVAQVVGVANGADVVNFISV